MLCLGTGVHQSLQESQVNETLASTIQFWKVGGLSRFQETDSELPFLEESSVKTSKTQQGKDNWEDL